MPKDVIFGWAAAVDAVLGANPAMVATVAACKFATVVVEETVNGAVPVATSEVKLLALNAWSIYNW